MTDGPVRVRVGERVTIAPRGKKSTWVAEFHRDGRHCRRSLRTLNKKVALQRAARLDAELAGGTYRDPPPPATVRQAADDYLIHLDTEGRAPKTLAKYRGVFAAVVEFWAGLGVTRLPQVAPAHLDRFRAARKQSGRHAKTMYTEGVIVKQLFRWAKTRRLLPDNPLADVRVHKPKLEPRGGPGLADVNGVLAALSEGDRAAVAVLAFTGMRSGELQRLRREDLDVEGGWLHVVSRAGAETKTRRSRKVPVHPRLRALLAAHARGPGPWLFPAPAGPRRAGAARPIDVRKLNERFQAALQGLGLPAGRAGGGFTLHSLRHFFETFCVNARVPQRAVDAWLGHAPDGSMAANYYKLPDAESRRFMEEVPFGDGTPAADAGREDG